MGKRVLVIEHNEGRIESLCSYLAHRGFDVRIARDGETGLWEAVSESPDWVIAGIDIPFVNGWEVCRELRNNPDVRRTPVVLIAGSVGRYDYAKAVLAGSEMLVTWPPYAVKMFGEFVEKMRWLTNGSP